MDRNVGEEETESGSQCDLSTSVLQGEMANELFGGEENEGEWFERGDHPLLNDVLLPILFGYVGGNDLKTCRLVCRKWNVHTLPFTRSRLEVSISGTKSKANGIGKFMELMNSNTLGIPFGRFKLGSFDTTQGFGQQFVQLLGKTTKELNLSNSEYFSVESISDLLRSMPKLESFTMPRRIRSEGDSAVQLFPGTKPKLKFLKSLIVENDDDDERRKICPTLYEELLGATPNISTFKLVSSFSLNNEACSEILETLEKLGRVSIECLTLPNISGRILEVLRKLGSKGMKLKKLHICVRESVENNLVWSELLTLFNQSMVSLNVCFSSSTRIDIDIIFPTLPKLVILELAMSGSTNLICQNFTKTFPALKELTFFNWNQRNEFNNFITGDTSSSSTLKSLCLGITPKMNMEILNRILAVCPALTRLDCEVTEEDGVEVITKIWSQMTQLQALRIRGTLPIFQNVDSLITGIPVQELEKIWVPDFFGSFGQTTTKIQRENILEDMMMDIDFKLPSIRNLTNLRSLSLHMTSSGSKTQTENYSTDSTAYFGLYFIKTLRHLSVSGCEFSKDCCETFVKDMDLMTWTFRSGSNLNIIPPRLNPNDKFEFCIQPPNEKSALSKVVRTGRDHFEKKH